MSERKAITSSTPHFTVAEALVGTGLTSIPPNVLPQVIRLAQILESVRQLLGNRAITPTSWYRPTEKNEAVGGSATSPHPKGFGADFVVDGLTPRQVVDMLAPYTAALGIDQLIEYPSHVHISADPRSRGQLLLALREGVGKDTTYVPWTPTAPRASAAVQLAGIVQPANEPGSYKKFSPLWWLAVLGIGMEIARHILGGSK